MGLSRSAKAFCVLALGASLLNCAFGDGEGQLEGLVWAPLCDWEAHPFALDPNFFGANPLEITETVDIKIQHGDGEIDSVDHWFISVSDATDFPDLLNVPIDLADINDDVEMTVYFGDSCKGSDDPLPNYQGVAGTVIFRAFYVPWVNGTGKYYEAELTGGVFVDTNEPLEKRAELDGNFRFKFRRGNPAQPFP